MRKTALYLHRFLGLAIEVVTFFVVFFPPYPWYTGVLVALTLIYIISFDYHTKYYLRSLLSTFDITSSYKVDLTRKIIIKTVILLLFCGGVWVFEFYPFFDMLWFFLLIGFTRFISAYAFLRKNAFFLVINEKEIIDYDENLSAQHYEFENLITLQIKKHTLLIKSNPILPNKIDLDINEEEASRLKTYLSTHAKSIFASFLSKGN
jgi:hypothetical protein